LGDQFKYFYRGREKKAAGGLRSSQAMTCRCAGKVVRLRSLLEKRDSGKVRTLEEIGEQEHLDVVESVMGGSRVESSGEVGSRGGQGGLKVGGGGSGDKVGGSLKGGNQFKVV